MEEASEEEEEEEVISSPKKKLVKKAVPKTAVSELNLFDKHPHQRHMVIQEQSLLYSN